MERTIVKRLSLTKGQTNMAGPGGKLELAFTSEGEALLVLDDKIIASRGPLCWVTEVEGLAIFDNDDRKGVILSYNAVGEDDKPIPVGTACFNELAIADFEKRHQQPTLH
jgi:hypothetical protein